MNSSVVRAFENPYRSSQVTYGIQASGTSELAGVRRGISAVYAALILSVLAVSAVFAIRFAQLRLPIEVFYALQAVQIGAGVLAVVGRSLCLSAPAAANGTGLIAAAVALEAIAMSVTIGRQFMPMPFQVVIGAGVLALIGYFLFLLFLKQIASYLKQPALQDSVQSTISMAATFLVCAIGFVVYSSVGRPNRVVALVGGISLLVLSLGMLVVYARLLSRMKAALRVAE